MSQETEHIGRLIALAAATIKAFRIAESAANLAALREAQAVAATEASKVIEANQGVSDVYAALWAVMALGARERRSEAVWKARQAAEAMENIAAAVTAIRSPESKRWTVRAASAKASAKAAAQASAQRPDATAEEKWEAALFD